MHGTLHTVTKRRLNATGPAFFVKQWVDYSTKYGIGYILNSDCIGVYFNDNSKLVQDEKRHYYYLERSRVAREDCFTTFPFDEVPLSQRKKVQILQ